MEGFSEDNAKDDGPGGQDAINPRILQLNVTGNDSKNFSVKSDFTDPTKNVAYPRFVEAQDPLHESFDPGTNGKGGSKIGLGLRFAKTALPNTSQDIILVPAAWAGSGFCANDLGEVAWNSTDPELTNSSLGGTYLYDRALTRVNIALAEKNGILRGILWHQGESDIQPDARGAQARGTSSDVPFVIGTMSRAGEFAIYDEPKTLVDDAHRTIPAEVRSTSISNHDDLIPPSFPCGQGFCVHFGADAYREMGRRYYGSLLDAIGQ